MTPDERAQIPPPEACRDCAHGNTYITMGVKRVLCSLGKPMHPNCQWHSPRLQGAQK